MSHELRTPLNAIGGYVDLLEMEVRGPVTAEQRTDLLRVRRSQQHLLHLINDVLDFPRSEAGQTQLRLRDVRIGEALEAAITLVAPQAAAKGQTLDVDANVTIVARADREKVEQILVNLLSNAVKFTARGGRITVRCSTEGDRVEVRVADTGIGIPAGRRFGVRAVRAGAVRADPPGRGHGPRSGDQPRPGARHGRRPHRREHAGRRLDVHARTARRLRSRGAQRSRFVRGYFPARRTRTHRTRS